MSESNNRGNMSVTQRSENSKLELHNGVKIKDEIIDENEVGKSESNEIAIQNVKIEAVKVEIDDNGVPVEEEKEIYKTNKTIKMEIDKFEHLQQNDMMGEALNKNIDVTLNHRTDVAKTNKICFLQIKQEKEEYVFEEFRYQSNAFQISDLLNTNANFKVEVKDEPEEVGNDDVNNSNSDDSTDEDSSVEDIESEYFAKLYKCRRCEFESTHREYKQHIMECDAIKQYKMSHQKKIYKCNQCNFEGVHKKYKQHIQKCKAAKYKRNRSGKLYQCVRCEFEGNSKEYKVHMEEHSEFKRRHINIMDYDKFRCTRCCKDYSQLKKYLMHLYKEHAIEKLTCPECNKRYINYTVLIIHLKSHIKQTFIPVRVINKDITSGQKYRCRKCKNVVGLDFNFFLHWESHLDIFGEGSQLMK